MNPTWESECGTVKLWLGDCMEVMATWPDGAVDAVVTDPPYGIDYQSAWRTDRTKWHPKIANDKSPAVKWISCVGFRACLCFCRWDTQEAFRKELSGVSRVRAQVIWDRIAHGMGDLRGAPAPVHDVVWFASRDGYSFPGRRPKSIVSHMRIGGDILRHPNEKPVSLMEELIEDYAHTPWVVADPFMGSGTTGVACVRLGRKFWGVEIDPQYFEIAKRRIQDELEKVKFLEPEPVETQPALFEEATQ